LNAIGHYFRLRFNQDWNDHPSAHWRAVFEHHNFQFILLKASDFTQSKPRFPSSSSIHKSPIGTFPFNDRDFFYLTNFHQSIFLLSILTFLVF
jgi:hypothetical protein